MGHRLTLSRALLFLSWLPCVTPGCRCSQDPEVLSHEDACEEIGYSLSNRTVACGESAKRGNEVFDEFKDAHECDDTEPAPDAGADGSAFVSILDCAAAMLSVPCELLIDPTGSLDTALQSSDACIAALHVQPAPDAGDEPCQNPTMVRCDGVCVDLKTDVIHCGGCGQKCPEDQTGAATPECNEGTCAFQCSGTTLDCDGDPANGCEVDWMNGDVMNCGGCGEACPSASRPGQVADCRGAACWIHCDETHLDCDNDDFNGCEVEIDKDNCFICGVDCDQDGLVVGECRTDSQSCETVETCPAGTLNCDDQPDCESTSSIDRCGGCSVQCPSQANATPVCGDAGCAIECLTGFLDCNDDTADGCEVEAAACP